MLSYLENIPTILAVAKGYKNIIDFGAGFGKYGMLIREQYLSDKAEHEITPVDDMYIIAVEDTPFMVGKLKKNWAYDNVMERSMFYFPYLSFFHGDSSPILHEFDETLALLIDVVEHHPKEKIIQWLRLLPCPVLISTPKNTVMYTQEFYGDSRHHQSQWDMSDFQATGKTITDYSNDLSWIVKLS